MSEGLKASLRRWPRLYRLLQSGYYKTLYLLEAHVLGSRLHAWIWRYGRPASLETLAHDMAHPHRRLVEAAVLGLGPVGSVLEIGCNAGANLIVLAGRLPAARLHGIDINAGAVAAGREWVKTHGLSAVTLAERSADDLRAYSDGEFDVALTDAVLMYLGPDRIRAVLREMVRVARVALVLNEWALPASETRLHVWYDLHWVHNYARLLQSVVPAALVSSERIPREVWGGTGWSEYGTLLTARLPAERAAASRVPAGRPRND